MYIIKLDAIDSTNAYLKAMATVNLPKDFTVVVADKQTDGRGQMGSTWISDSGKNLTASVFKELSGFDVEKQYFISMCIALSIHSALETFKIPKLSIKWPNDILSADKKICGILIENVIKNNKFQGSVIGFGINVNQIQFDNLPQASSLKQITGKTYNKEELLSAILKQIPLYFEALESQKFDDIKREYESLLFRIEKPSTFKLQNNEIFSGIIKGVEDTGKLKVWTENDIIKSFDLKEVSLLY
jgi:BirA family biotin operon repressor/biotin-[acetyl-CoA-carboxylase] ligase